jgi:hypothetical protein
MQWRKNKHLFELLKKNDGLFNVCFSQRPLSFRKVKKKSLRSLLYIFAALREKTILQSKPQVLSTWLHWWLSL